MNLFELEADCPRCYVLPTLRVIRLQVFTQVVDHLSYVCPRCGLNSGPCITESEASEFWNDSPREPTSDDRTIP